MQNQFKLTIGIGLICLILLLASSAVPAEIYKWKDQDGKIHYSDSPPPPGVDAEIKKFEEPPSKEKSKTRINPPRPKLDPAPSAGSEVGIKKPKEEPVPTVKPKVQSSPPPQRETLQEKKPYSNIHVIMYMTSW
jgi:hypothetical protein